MFLRKGFYLISRSITHYTSWRSWHIGCQEYTKTSHDRFPGLIPAIQITFWITKLHAKLINALLLSVDKDMIQCFDSLSLFWHKSDNFYLWKKKQSALFH